MKKITKILHGTDALYILKLQKLGVETDCQRGSAVFKEEIFSAPNVFFTPHAAFYSETALDEANRIAANNVVHFFAGAYDQVRFVVRPEGL